LNAEADSNDTAAPSAEGLRWYVIHAYSGFEEAAKKALEQRIAQHHMEEYFGAIVVPQQETETVKGGKKKTIKSNQFPGYLLVKMRLTPEVWQVLKDTQKITGIVGGHQSPPEISEEEVNTLLSRIQTGELKPVSKTVFDNGETVKIKEGPFADFTGTVEEVKPEKRRIKVLVSIFGRATPVELDFSQVSKVV
jgi:transcriptional antiterminator NusG